MMKRILAFLLLFACASANAQFTFTTGQVLAAGQLNSAFEAVLPLTGGTLTGPLTVPTIGVTSGITVPTRTAGDNTTNAATTAFVSTSLLNRLTHVANNSSLQSITTTLIGVFATIHRDGYATAGDGGKMDYNWTASACSLNSGAGDNGSQVQAAGAGCWIWDPQASGVPPEVFGADTTATNDNAAFTNEIAALQSYSGNVNTMLLGARTYNTSQSITVNGPYPVSFRGQGMGVTTIQAAAGGSYNLISYGNTAATGTQTQFGGIYNLRLMSGSGATAGYAISAVHTANFTVRDVAFQAYCGIEDEQSNNNLYDNVWGYTVGTGCQAFFAHVSSATQTAGGRTDQLTMNNVHLDAGFYGNDCFVWQGMVQTVNSYNNTFLQCNHGFWANASQDTSSLFPQFGFIYNLQVEGAQTAPIEIDGGRDFHFTDSAAFSDYGETGPGGSQGDNDAAALVIEPDGAESVTSNISWSGGSIGNSAHQAAVMFAQGVRISNTVFRDSSLASQYASPSVELQGSSSYASQDYQLSNDKFCTTYGETPYNSYGLVRDANVGTTIISNADFTGCHTGEISDASAMTNLAFYGGIDRNQVALPVSLGKFHSNAQPTVTSCGTSPAIGTSSSNDIAGVISTGTGTFTSCTLTFASAWPNPPTAFLQGTGTVPYYITGQTTTSFTFARTDGGNMAGLTVYYRATLGGN
jgi:hypothetical protein